jgi:hypothetical protein
VSTRALVALILSSTLVTLDGTAVVRAAGFLAVAVLGTLAFAGAGKAGISPEDFRQALAVCAGVVMLAGIGAARMIRDRERGGLAKAA